MYELIQFMIGIACMAYIFAYKIGIPLKTSLGIQWSFKPFTCPSCLAIWGSVAIWLVFGYSGGDAILLVGATPVLAAFIEKLMAAI